MSINYNEDAGETAGTMELDIEFVMISTIKKKSRLCLHSNRSRMIKNSITSQDVEGTSFFSQCCTL